MQTVGRPRYKRRRWRPVLQDRGSLEERRPAEMKWLHNQPAPAIGITWRQRFRRLRHERECTERALAATRPPLPPSAHQTRLLSFPQHPPHPPPHNKKKNPPAPAAAPAFVPIQFGHA